MTAILVVCGLTREAALVDGTGIVTVVSGGDRAALESRLALLSNRSLSAVISFGLAGALDPALGVGDVLLPETIVTVNEAARYAASHDLTERLRHIIAARGIALSSASAMAGVDAPAATAAAKTVLRTATQAAAVDMESHVAAEFAERRGMPFAALRVVSDAADRDIPDAALKAMRPDGGIDAAVVAGSLLRDPRQVPALVRLARDGARAFRVLKRLGEVCRAVAAVSSRR